MSDVSLCKNPMAAGCERYSACRRWKDWGKVKDNEPVPQFCASNCVMGDTYTLYWEVEI